MHQKMVEINKSKRCKSKTILFGGDILKKKSLHKNSIGKA